MQKSESIKEIATAMATFQEEVKNITKDGTNPFFKSKYATLENLRETVKEPLHANGLSYSQFPDEDGLTTILMHVSGEWMMATARLQAKDQTPQGQGSAITYMRRYALAAILGLATEDDDDGNAASNPVAKAVTQMLSKPSTPAPKPATKIEPPTSLAAKTGGKKAMIYKLIADKTLMPLLTDKEHADYVFQATGLVLNAENADAIIAKLKN